LPHHRQKPHRKKTHPDRPPRGCVSINLGEDVAADISNRKKQLRSADQQRPNLADFGSDEVGDDEDDDESNRQSVQITIAEGHPLSIAQS